MSNKTILLTVFVVIKFFLQYILISPLYDLQRDEYLHLDQANHLAWGYLSVPPVTSWNSYLIKLLGNSVFWIKFFPALFGALTMVVVWKTIEELKGNLYALVLGATCVLFSILLRLNTLYQPNSLEVLCWTTFCFVLVKYFNSGNTKWLFWGAAVFALGFLNKYNVALLLVGMVPAVIASPHRKILTQQSFYLTFLLGIVLVLPNLVWQHQNDLPVFHHLKLLSETHLVHVDRLGFLKSQVFFFAGSLPVIVLGLYALLCYAPFKKLRPFFWSFFFTLLVFLYFKAKDYYAISLYPIYIAFGSVYLGHILESGWRRYLQPVFLLLPLLIFIPMYQYVFPNRSPEYIVQHGDQYRKLGLLRWEDGRDHLLPQDFADMLGWRELSEKVDSVYAGLPDQGKILVLCDNYGQAGAINYYSIHGIQAVSFNADYVNWFDLSEPYTHLIRVKSRSEKDQEFIEISPYFHSSAIADSISNPYSREYGTVIFSFEGAKVDINKRIKSEIAEVKAYQ